MNIPLSVKPIVQRNKEKLSIWYNGKNKIINAPINPYFYSYKDLEISCKRKTTLQKKCLSRMEEKTFYKYEFQTREQLVQERQQNITFEDNIPFLIRNRIDMPDIYTKFQHTKELKFLFIDIEQYTKPSAPFPDYSDRIISISLAKNDRKVLYASINKDDTSDKKLLLAFKKVYESYQPDVIVVYNQSYDIPTIIKRLERNRISTTFLSKNNTKPRIIGKEKIEIEGVVIYDVMLSARDDQSLTGNVINRGLKEVSNWFGFKETIKPLNMKHINDYIGTPELKQYNQDDVRRLILAFDIYWPNIEYNANDLSIPLDMAMYLNITDLGLLVVGDEYREHGIIADGSNYHRYPEIFQRKQPGGNYEGALVGIEKTGHFEPVYKEDYGSMYPTIMSEFNLSPDTTTLVRYEPYGKFKIEEHKDWFVYHIPDKTLNKTMIIQVLKKEGFCSKMVKRFLQERSEYKKLWRETKDKKYRAMSDNRKVKANGGVYGIQGSAKHAFGFAPIAIATTGIGRECAQLLINVLNELYPNSVIEWDTDGIYFHTKVFSEEHVLTLFSKNVKEKFKKDLNLSIDVDEYDSGYFYKAKNYVLKRGEKLIYHGAAMKARNKDLLSKEFIQEMSVAKLNRSSTEEIVQRYLKLDFPLKYFAMNVTMGRHMSQYKNLNSLAPRLAVDAENYLGIKPEIGNQYYYVKTKSGYSLFERAERQHIDTEYYREELKRIMSMFNVEPITKSIDEWL